VPEFAHKDRPEDKLNPVPEDLAKKDKEQIKKKYDKP